MRTRKIVSWVLVGVLAVVGIWGYNQYEEKTAYQIFLENQHLNDFYSLIDSVENIEAFLAKSMVSQSGENMSMLFTETWKNADHAQQHLNRLPISHLALNKTSKFLSQLGDFTYTIGKQSINGENLSNEQWADLERLHNNCGDLIITLQGLQDEITSGGVRFGDLRQEGQLALGRISDNIIVENLTRIEKEMTNYPKLIYDGPFSEHISDIKPKGPKGERITPEQGEEIVISFLGQDKIGQIQTLGNGEGIVPSYSYEIMPANEQEERRIYVDVSQTGGKVLWMMDNKAVNNVNLSMGKALQEAQEFLEEQGFDNMVPSYSERYNGVGVFNFAYEQDEVLMYPDLIKVQIALDNGDITGFEAQGFHIAHEERDIPEPGMDLEDARSRVSHRLDIYKERLAIIPTETREEVLCYEFKGNFQDDTFIVYINAETGEEQDILKVIRTNNGDLTM